MTPTEAIQTSTYTLTPRGDWYWLKIPEVPSE